MFRALSTRVAKRWQLVSFRGAKKGEWRGVVDLIAIRKDTAEPKTDTLKRGDLFDLVLVQLKGGSARARPWRTAAGYARLPSSTEPARSFSSVGEEARAQRFRCWEGDLEWKESSGAEIFG